MIDDPLLREEIRKEWAGAIAIREAIKRSGFASAAGIGGRFPMFAIDCAHNLPFLHARGVLNEALRAVDGSSRTLGALVKKYEPPKLPWVDYDGITEIVKKRNDLAHEGLLLPRGNCWRCMSTIEAELRAWSVIV